MNLPVQGSRIFYYPSADCEEGEVVCPHCGSKDVEQRWSAFSVIASKKKAHEGSQSFPSYPKGIDYGIVCNETRNVGQFGRYWSINSSRPIRLIIDERRFPPVKNSQMVLMLVAGLLVLVVLEIARLVFD